MTRLAARISRMAAHATVRVLAPLIAIVVMLPQLADAQARAGRGGGAGTSSRPPAAARTAASGDADMPVLRVRGAVADSTLRVETVRGTAMIEAAPLARLLGGTLVRRDSLRHQFRLGALSTELVVGSPFFRRDTTAWPLAAAPALRANDLFVPLQFVADYLPMFAGGVKYDAATRELTSVSVAAAPVATVVTPPARPAQPERKPVVVVDAGHGGAQPGMVGRLPNGRSVAEKDVTLGIATKLAPLLREMGFDVVMTRTRDSTVSLRDRGRIANQARGDLLISIHVNSAGVGWKNRTSARGLETFFLAEARTEDERRVEEMENEVIRGEEDLALSGPLSFILNDMAQNQHLRESSELAETIQRVLAPRHPGPDRGVKQANLAVLAYAYMPAVLVETGFGSNAAEMEWLASGPGQSRLANDLAAATAEYFRVYRQRIGAASR